MNRRSTLVLLAGVVALLVAAAIWWPRSARPPVAIRPSSDTSPSPASMRVAATSPSTSPKQLDRDPSPEQLRTGGTKLGGLAMLSAARIEFYGKVIDQDGKPLPGVEVIGGTGSSTGFMQQEVRSYSTASDGNGLFNLKGFRGDALIIELKKTGYNFESNRIRFHYSSIDPDQKRFTPDRDNPVVFQMWKSLGPEPLIHYSSKAYSSEALRVPIDGTPIKVDLITGKKVKTGGDLTISVKWESQDSPGSYLIDWSAKLEVPEGGILEDDGDVKFLAPMEGYKAALDYRFAPRRGNSEMKHTYYIQGRRGQVYARVELSLQNQAVDRETDLRLRVWLNPGGSRNLEYDPHLKVSAP